MSIAFVIRYPFHFFLYQRIAHFLAGEVEFVLDTQEIARAPLRGRLSETFRSFLERSAVPYRIYNRTTAPVDFFNRYDVLVANTFSDTLALEANQRRKKVRLMYGYAKELWNFGVWSRHFDLTFTFGEYAERMLEPLSRCVSVGVPQFDAWFADKRPRRRYDREILPGIDTAKQTLLYLPTHGDLASLPHVAAELTEAAQYFNVIVKPHSLTLAWEPEFLAPYRDRPGVMLLDDFLDTAEVLRYADVVLSDNSGAIFDALLVDVPIVILDFWQQPYFAESHRVLEKLDATRWRIPLTHAGSIEQRVKSDPDLSIGEIVTKPSDIAGALERVFITHRQRSKTREQLRIRLFKYRDGRSSERVATALRALQGEPRRGMKPLAKAIDRRIATALSGLEAEASYLEREIQRHIPY